MSSRSKEYSDIATQATCDDAASCKRYAVRVGYWKDKYLQHMVHGSMQKRQPEINRGYFARTEKIWQLINRFISISNRQCQVVSLGCGLDTTFWRLHEVGCLPVRYIEVDFHEVVLRKLHVVSSKDVLNSCVGQVQRSSKDPPSMHCERYHIVSADLRDLEGLTDSLESSEIDYSLPTLFLTECVMVYMPPESSANIIKWSSEAFSNAVFVNYEQINMEDTFGQVMVQNLKARGCILAGVQPCSSIESQKERFFSLGWPSIWCEDMWCIYNSLPDKRQIERLEFLDESEPLQQLLEHYCISVAIKDTTDIGLLEMVS